MGCLMLLIGIPGHDHAVKSARFVLFTELRRILEGDEVTVDPGMAIRQRGRAMIAGRTNLQLPQEVQLGNEVGNLLGVQIPHQFPAHTVIDQGVGAPGNHGSGTDGRTAEKDAFGPCAADVEGRRGRGIGIGELHHHDSANLEQEVADRHRFRHSRPSRGTKGVTGEISASIEANPVDGASGQQLAGQRMHMILAGRCLGLACRSRSEGQRRFAAPGNQTAKELGGGRVIAEQFAPKERGTHKIFSYTRRGWML